MSKLGKKLVEAAREAVGVTRMKLCPPSRVARYMGRTKPQCFHGIGCTRCWQKWHIVNNRGGQDDRPQDAEGSTPMRPVQTTLSRKLERRLQTELNAHLDCAHTGAMPTRFTAAEYRAVIAALRYVLLAPGYTK